MILDENPIPQLIARHRKLKAQRDVLDDKLKLVKAELAPMVEANGKWQDGQGYARMVERKAANSYPSASVDRLAITWSGSSDPIMQSCGNMLLDLRKSKAGYSYLQIK